MAFEWLTNAVGDFAGWIVGTGVAGTPSAASMQKSIDTSDAALRDLNASDYGEGGRIYEAIQDERGRAEADNTAAFGQSHENYADVAGQISQAGREGAQGALQSGLNA